jgi:hypothetical protein
MNFICGMASDPELIWYWLHIIPNWLLITGMLAVNSIMEFVWRMGEALALI